MESEGDKTTQAEKFCNLLASLIKDFQWLEVDLELMWSLLPTSVLKSNGEATYYLTLISSAINTYKTGKTDTTSSTPQTEVSTVKVLKIVLSCIYSRKAIVFLGKSH